MASLLNSTPTEAPVRKEEGLFWTLLLVMLLSFGATLALFSLLYVRDLQTLRNLPTQVWAFICGTPAQDGIILPVLVLTATLSFMMAALVWGVRRIRRAA